MRIYLKPSTTIWNGKSKKSRKLKKEMNKKNKIKKKIYNKKFESLGMFSRFFFLFLMSCCDPVGPAPIINPKYSLQNAAKDASCLSRTLNWIAIVKGLKDGTITWAGLMNDFLGLGEEISLPVLRGEKWEEVETLTNKLSEAVREQCVDDKSCVKMDAVSSGIQTLEIMNVSSVENMFAVLKTFEPLVALKNIYDNIQNSMSSMGVIIQNIEKIPNERATGSLLPFFRLVMEPSLGAFDTDSNSTSTAWMSIKVLNDLEPNFHSVLQYEVEIKEVESKTDIMKAMKTTLKKVGEIREKLLYHLKNGKQETVTRILKLLLQIGNSEEKKVLTSGLLNGTSEIKQIPKDLDDPFFVEVISNRSNVTIFRDMLFGAFKMPTELESLETSDGIRRVLIKAGARIHQVEKNLESAFTDLQQCEIFEKLLKCMELERFTSPPDSKKWSLEKDYYTKHRNDVTNFLGKLKTTPFPSDRLVKYKDLKGIVAMDVESEKSDALNSFNFNELKTELQDFKKVLEEICLDGLQEWARKTDIDGTVDDMVNSMNGTNFGSIIECAKKDGVLAQAKNLSANSQLFSSLSKFSSTNEDLLATREAVQTIQKPIRMYLNLTRTQRKIARHRKRHTPSNSTKLLSLTKSFAGGVRILRNLAMMDESRDSIKKMADSSDEIDANIEKLDPQQAAEVKKHWTPEMKKFIKELSSQIKKVEESIQDRPHEIADFKNVFNSISKIDLPNLKSLHIMRQFTFLKKPDELRGALDTFGSLDLDFNSAAMKLGVSIASLTGIRAVLDDFFKIDRNASVITLDDLDQTTQEPNNTVGLWTIIGGSLFAILILIGASVGGYFLKKYYDKRRRYAKIAKEHKKEMDQLAKDNPAREAVFRSEKGQKLKAIIQPKKTNSTSAPNIANAANAPKANSGVKPKTTAKKVTKRTKKVPAKEVLSNAHSEKDGACLVVKKKMSKYQTKDVEQTTKEDVIAAHKPKNEEKMKEELDSFDSQEAKAKEFRDFHPGIDPVQLRREAVIKMDKNHNQKKPDDRKLYLAPNIDKNNLKEDNYYAKPVTDQKDAILPDRFTMKIAKEFLRMIPGTVPWSAINDKIVVGLIEEYLVSSNDTREILSEVRKFFKYVERELVTLEDTQDMSSRMSSRTSRRMSKAQTEQELLDMQTARSDRRAAAGVDKSPDLPPLDFSTNIHDKNHALRNFIAMTAHSYRSLQSGEYYKGGYPITIQMLEDAMEKAITQFRNDPALVRIASKRVYKVGDIHGNYMDFVRHVIIMLCDPDAVGVFLGDYVDRGNRSVDVVYLMCLLKQLYPKKFIFLRGNHETPSINRAYGFLEECMTLYDATEGKNLWRKVNDNLFSELPLCGLFHNKVFLAHGGVSELFLEGVNVLDEITKRPRTIREWKIYYDLLWSDPLYIFYPDNIDRPVFTKSPRCNYATVFNQFALDKVLEVQGWILVVRAHEVVKHGFEFFHKQRLLTIFGACNNSENNKAVQSCLTSEGLLTFRRFQSLDGLEDEDDDVLTEG